MVKEDANKRLFAFVCFKEKNDAKKAFKEIENQDIFGSGEKVYVNWAMKK
jgi:hypothetical protein